MLNLAYASPRDARKGGPNTVLTGEFRHTVDAKNRLFIPAKHREELGEEDDLAGEENADVNEGDAEADADTDAEVDNADATEAAA